MHVQIIAHQNYRWCYHLPLKVKLPLQYQNWTNSFHYQIQRLKITAKSHSSYLFSTLPNLDLNLNFGRHQYSYHQNYWFPNALIIIFCQTFIKEAWRLCRIVYCYLKILDYCRGLTGQNCWYQDAIL